MDLLHVGKDEHLFVIPAFDSQGSYTKNPYQLRNDIIPNEANVGAQRTTKPQAKWFLVLGGCQVGNYVIS